MDSDFGIVLGVIAILAVVVALIATPVLIWAHMENKHVERMAEMGFVEQPLVGSTNTVFVPTEVQKLSTSP